MKLEEIINNNLTETLKINDISVIDTKFTHGLEVASELLINTFQKKSSIDKAILLSKSKNFTLTF